MTIAAAISLLRYLSANESVFLPDTGHSKRTLLLYPISFQTIERAEIIAIQYGQKLLQKLCRVAPSTECPEKERERESEGEQNKNNNQKKEMKVETFAFQSYCHDYYYYFYLP